MTLGCLSGPPGSWTLLAQMQSYVHLNAVWSRPPTFFIWTFLLPALALPVSICNVVAFLSSQEPKAFFFINTFTAQSTEKIFSQVTRSDFDSEKSAHYTCHWFWNIGGYRDIVSESQWIDFYPSNSHINAAARFSQLDSYCRHKCSFWYMSASLAFMDLTFPVGTICRWPRRFMTYRAVCSSAQAQIWVTCCLVAGTQKSLSWCVNFAGGPTSLSYRFTFSVPLYILHYFH